MRNLRQMIQSGYNRFALKANGGAIGLGLIGIGGWGASNAVHIMRSKRFNIVGVYDIRTKIASRFANRFKTKCYNRIDDLLNDPAIQAVCITVPNHFHMELVKAAADSQKHIFIEKPLASKADACRELGAYCKDKKIILQVGHQMRRYPAFREIKRILVSSELGRPFFVQGALILARRTRNDWRSDGEACPGGSMEQLGVHFIDVLIYLFGLPLDTHGWAKNIPAHSNEPDLGYVSLSFESDIYAVISTSFSSPSHMRLDFFFDAGHLATDGQTLWINRPNAPAKAFKPKGIPGEIAQFGTFADCIEQTLKPETGADEAAAVMDVVRSIFK